MPSSKEPWDKPNPRKKAGKPSKHLTPKKKTKAKAIARAHGRSRPSLVDNMNAAKGAGAKKSATKKSVSKKAASKKTTAKKTASKKTATKSVRKAAPKKSAARKPAATATKKRTSSKSARKPATKKTPGKSPPSRTATGARIKDPQGGLTAAGRKAFAQSQGAHLRPGVTKPESEMSPDDMRRKGSWAVRFYGRKVLPPLVDEKGEPTRLALSAHAWGEPVPTTEDAARKIADDGRKLLERYKAIKEG